MNKLLLLSGIILILLGLSQGLKYLLDYALLTEYGKGVVWGSVLLTLAGGGLIFFGIRRNTNSGKQH